MKTDRLILLSEVGQMLAGRSVKTVRRKIAAGELPEPVYVGRTPTLFLSDVISYMEKLKEKREAEMHD
jgi:predicted DNA-binding transcriptional regulator AlpA